MLNLGNPEKESRTARVDLRLTPEEKQIIAAAAAFEKMDMSAFMRRTILAQAQQIIRQAESIRLSKRDFSTVMDLLENPPTPTPALIKAATAKHGRQ